MYCDCGGCQSEAEWAAVASSRADSLEMDLEDARAEIAALHRAISRITGRTEFFDEELGWIGG